VQQILEGKKYNKGILEVFEKHKYFLIEIEKYKYKYKYSKKYI